MAVSLYREMGPALLQGKLAIGSDYHTYTYILHIILRAVAIYSQLAN